MDEHVEVPMSLYSWISHEDPLRITKCCQIKYWWYAFSDIYGSYNLDTLVAILSREDYWGRVDNFHGVKLDGPVLGQRLYNAPLNYNFINKLKVACRHCLEEDIATLIHESKGSVAFGDICFSYAQYTWNDTLVKFWVHFLDGRMEKIKPFDLHVFEYGFQCAFEMNQLLAMEFFWNKIKQSPEREIRSKRKYEIIMSAAVSTADSHLTRPEIFEFSFSQIQPEKYSEFLEMEFRSNDCYKSLTILLNVLRFDEFKALFDCLMPNQISVDLYCSWIHFLGMDDLSGRYMGAAVGAFIHMWERTGFDEHRSAVYSELAISRMFQNSLLVPLLSKGYGDIVWTILDRASREQIDRYMDSENSDAIVDLLLQRKDNNSLYKFLTYQTTLT